MFFSFITFCSFLSFPSFVKSAPLSSFFLPVTRSAFSPSAPLFHHFLFLFPVLLLRHSFSFSFVVTSFPSSLSLFSFSFPGSSVTSFFSFSFLPSLPLFRHFIFLAGSSISSFFLLSSLLPSFPLSPFVFPVLHHSFFPLLFRHVFLFVPFIIHLLFILSLKRFVHLKTSIMYSASKCNSLMKSSLCLS